MMAAVANSERAHAPFIAAQHQVAAVGTRKFAELQPDCWRVGYGIQLEPADSGTPES